MKDCYYESYAVSVREKFAKLQKFTSTSIVLMALMSLGYFVFWLGAISDEVFYEYGRPYFEPLASFLNLGATDTSIYFNTCMMLFFGIIPVIFAQYFLDKTQDALIQQDAKRCEKKRLKEQQEAQKMYMSRFDSIQTYSICLSVDYESEKELSKKNKETLNKAVFEKLAQYLSSVDKSAQITQSDVFILTSHDFSKYDTVYDSILRELSSLKDVIDKTYNLKLTPSITTDAFAKGVENTSIRKQHFEIQSFNFKNRALTTAMFANKYKHLRHKKYAGIPIGAYAYFRNKGVETYELNIIHKNLCKTIART